MTFSHRARFVGTIFALVFASLVSCGGAEPIAVPGRKVIVVGVDGGEWRVIRRLWSQGKLPNLKSLAERGAIADLQTDYGESPVIWTTIATGYRKEEHGITGFIVPSPSGDIPISSAARKVPALWNWLTLFKRKVAVLGWYATWPAEEVNGLVMTDRIHRSTLPGRVYPLELLDSIESELAVIRERTEEENYPLIYAGPDGYRDILIEEMAPRLAAEDYDLVLAYFRTVDHLSHTHWHTFEPDEFDDVDPEDVKAEADWIPAAYERFDRVIGRLVEAAPDANVIVVSDHGFLPALDKLQMKVNLDVLLEHLGYFVPGADGIDMPKTLAYSFDSPWYKPRKRIRLALEGEVEGGTVSPADLAALWTRLANDLKEVKYETGEPAFDVRPPTEGAPEIMQVVVQTEAISKVLLVKGERVADVVLSFSRITGHHEPKTPGIFLAAGPDIEPGANLDGIDIHDITPTVLYALGLPVSEDFAGRAWRELFTSEKRAQTPLRQISAWGHKAAGEAVPTSDADVDIIEELQALGYLQ